MEVITATPAEPKPSVAVAPLQALHQTQVTPETTQQAQHTRLLNALDRIASVTFRETVKEDGHRFFVVDAVTTSAVGSRHDNHVQSKYRYYEFANLRRSIYYHTDAGHRDEKRPCVYCAKVVDVLRHGSARPQLLKQLFQSDETLAQQLESFLNTALQLALQARGTGGGRWCDGREMVPLLVKQFLLGDDGEEDVSTAGTTGDSRRDLAWCGVPT